MALDGPRPRLVGHLVVEGVVVTSQSGAYAAAVRRATQEIIVRRRPPGSRRGVFWRLWGVRNLLQAATSLARYLAALYFSAQQAGLVDSLARAQVGTGALPPLNPQEALKRRLRVAATLISLGLAIAFGVVAWVLLPLLLSGNASERLRFAAIIKEMLVGLIGIPLYVAVVGRLPLLSRALGYHGALHRVLTAYHQGVSLEVRAVSPHPLHLGPCTLYAALWWAVMMPWTSRLVGLASNPWRGALLAVGHAPSWATTFGARLVIGTLTFVLAKEAYHVLARLPLGRLSVYAQTCVTWTVAEPSLEMTEVVLAAVRAAAQGAPSGAEREADVRAGFVPLADACTHGAARTLWSRPKTLSHVGTR